MGARRIHRLALDHVRHGAIGARLGQQHGLVGIEELGRLAHKLNAAQNDGLLRQGLCEFCQVERIAHVVGHGLDLGRHIIVGQNHGIVLGLKRIDGTGQLLRHKSCPLRSRRCRRQTLLDVTRQIGGTCQLRLSHVGPSRIGYIWGHSMPLVKTGDKTAVKSAHWKRWGEDRLPRQLPRPAPVLNTERLRGRSV